MRVAVLGTQAKDLVNFRGHLLSELAKAGHEAYGLAPEGSEETAAALARLGATFVPIRLDRTGLNPLRELVNAFRLWRQFRRLRLDLLLSYELKSVVFGTLAAQVAGVPRRFAMITGRGTTLQGEARGFRERAVRAVVKRLYRLALPRTHGVFFQNQDDCDFFGQERMLPATTPRKLINGSGVDLDHFRVAPLPAPPVTFLFVGRLLRNKGLREFVEASRLLAARRIPFRSRILGPLDPNPNGIPEAQLKSWISEGCVEYLGEAKDVRPHLAQAHAMVLPSYGEGTPRSVLEAMAAGRAVVTTRVPGCKETVLEGQTGFLVPARDPGALAEAMARFVADPALAVRMGEQGRQYAAAKYDVHKVNHVILGALGLDAQRGGD